MGIEVAGADWTIHGIDADGGWVEICDEVGEVDGADPMRSAVTSRLFGDRVVMSTVLARTLRFWDHPWTRGSGRRVLRPAFHTRPELGPALRPDPRGRLGSGGKGLRRADLEVIPPGHLAGTEDSDVDPTLAFNLMKRSALDSGPLEAVVRTRGRRRVVLAALDGLGNPAYPAADPAAFRWAVADLPASLGLWIAAAGLGEVPRVGAADPLAQAVLAWLGGGDVALRPDGEGVEAALGCAWSHLACDQALPPALVDRFTGRPPSSATLSEIAIRGLCQGGSPGRATVGAAISSLKRGIRRHPDLWPSGLEVWALADAAARLGGRNPRLAPVAHLGLPLEDLRLAAVRPLAGWIRGWGDRDEVDDACLLVIASGDAPRYLVDLEV